MMLERGARFDGKHASLALRPENAKTACNDKRCRRPISPKRKIRLLHREHRDVGGAQHAEADAAQHAANSTQAAAAHDDEVAIVLLGVA